MIFLSPGRLWLALLVVAVAVAYALVQGRPTGYAVRFTNLALLDRVAPRRPGWRRHLPAAGSLLGALLLVGALAQPALPVLAPRERATIVVAIDVSISMKAEDVAPNRLLAAEQAARRFVARLPARFNVGLVAFAGTATIVNSPTRDRAAVLANIDRLRLQERTAIGEAVFAGLEALRAFDAQAAQDPPPAAIVLLSDGDNSTGRSIGAAVAAARGARVPVSTIAFGTPDGYVVAPDGVREPVRVNKTTLRELATGSGGRAYEAESLNQLDEVYRDVRSSLGFQTVTQEVTLWLVGAGLVLVLLASVGSLVWFARLP